MINRRSASLGVLSGVLLAGCAATESSKSLKIEKVDGSAGVFSGERTSLVVGKFDNKSSYMRGVFSDGVDRLGGQAKTTLISHLQQSQRFSVMDRDSLAEAAQEVKFQGGGQNIKGASFLVVGDISEFGRKEVGDHQLFGVLGRGKKQIAYAKITLNVIRAATSEVVYSAQGAGEYELSNREVLGFGGTAGYDSTLNGKVLDLAMREAVNNLVAGKDAGRWGR